jgi:hypothetical protein
LRKPTIHCRFHKNLPSGPILSDIESTFSRHIYFLFTSVMQVYIQFMW